MRISDGTVEKLLTQSGRVSSEQIATLKEEGLKSNRPLQDLAVEDELFDEKTLTKLFAEYADIPYIELDPHDIPSDVLDKIPEHIARQYNAVLFRIDSDGLHHLAMDDPDDVQAVDFIEKQIGEKVRTYIASHNNILAALDNYRGDVDKELNDVIDIQREDNTANENVSDEDVAENSPIAQTINLLLEYAIRSSASDIHIEPREEFVQIRYRIDGVLKEVNRLPRNVHAALVSRIKILSNLKIDERRVPQDGRFKVKVAGKQYALRVSTLPIADGEKVVMRILDESNQAVTLDQLGYWGHSLSTLSEAITEPNGMVLVTGPTGSGKSTSLFSVLSLLNQPDVNISTVEDPVEYKIPGVNQTQTNSKAGMTFASGLRALLRQDPNIIMVGEIRDGETANLGVQAALTGHLVFSTLHTNNAATCLPRLLDMDIEPFLIASTVRAVVGQRLVRRLDKTTRVAYAPTEEEQQAIVHLFNLRDGQDFHYIHELEKQAAAQGVGGNAPLSTDENGILTLYKPGESEDNTGKHDGYKGRIGIYEVLSNTNSIQKLITSNATSNEIQKQAIAEGMLTMQTDGLIKALRGETTIEEIIRVTKE
ncbi:type II/IV secretion system protein [Candidatus Saccharibacteria bacterium]|nr:type II/IV secretion system protein [Candidatus Saccharibacteria bacterium]MBH1973418.1 type II/IV secretion system protein [Candidatus Saccharibacteria bacterium]MBH1990341.1 type II/IV secretion system protein [Candidatus Saccharibacteria bacterium]OGL24174.1 MAG: secretion system protein E [Candidatus Saccharibacteria bacterium RIFCSPHIGHO2_01_FULL_46_30]